MKLNADQNRNVRYEASLRQMGQQAKDELESNPELCTCKEADYTVGVYAHQCLHHQLIDWVKVLDYEIATGEVV
tara:strand:- start:12038 stop:12259 length:222 start_codon:yes stop_codon:yes gene_type:complete